MKNKRVTTFEAWCKAMAEEWVMPALQQFGGLGMPFSNIEALVRARKGVSGLGVLLVTWMERKGMVQWEKGVGAGGGMVYETKREEAP